MPIHVDHRLAYYLWDKKNTLSTIGYQMARSIQLTQEQQRGHRDQRIIHRRKDIRKKIEREASHTH